MHIDDGVRCLISSGYRLPLYWQKALNKNGPHNAIRNYLALTDRRFHQTKLVHVRVTRLGKKINTLFSLKSRQILGR